MRTKNVAGRRSFIKQTAAMTAGLAGLGILPEVAVATADTGINILGPKPGYSPQVGTMVSMLMWMQDAVVGPVQGMSKQDLDYLFDAHANSIGALLLHLAATETYYQMNTFQGMKWDSWPDAVKQKWDPAMNLGDAGRKTIKGNELGYYRDALRETREKSLAKFRKRDDAWLMAVDQTWPWGPTNNYCKWFHVCEHESHHAGQIDMLKKRLPRGQARCLKDEPQNLEHGAHTSWARRRSRLPFASSHSSRVRILLRASAMEQSAAP